MKEAKAQLNVNEANPFAVIDKIVHTSNLDQGAAIVILQQIQAAFGYVSPEMLDRISQLTGIPTSVLYSIVTFYAQFRLEPVGEYLIQVCHGTACHLAGAERVSQAVQMESGATEGHTSPDGKFTLEKVACLGCCTLGPVMTINEETFGRMTPELARKLIKAKREGSEMPADDEGQEGGDIQ